MRIADLLSDKPGEGVVTISPEAGVRELVALLAEHNIGAVVVSSDGSAIEGIAIANLLANLPASVHVRIVVDGVAASAASMIALAGAELVMSPGSQLMVHDAWMVTAGNEAELRAEAEPDPGLPRRK